MSDEPDIFDEALKITQEAVDATARVPQSAARERQLDQAFELIHGAWMDNRRLLPEEILDLFDRFEEEKWGEPGEVPSGEARRVLVCADGVVFDMYWIGTAAWGASWRFRELPAPPQP